MKNKITVFALSSSLKLAQDICDNLGCELGKSVVHHFADGEILVELGESVRGKDVFIVQSTSNPVTENLMEILVLADALKRASAKEITAIIPYFGYARQDRKAKPRQPITAKLVADLKRRCVLPTSKIANLKDIPQIYDMYLQPPHHNNEQVAINWIIGICSQLSSN